MLNRSIIIILAVISGVLLSSCSSKFSLTKRRYTRGYHLDVAGNKPKTKERPVVLETTASGKIENTLPAAHSQKVSDSKYNGITGNTTIASREKTETTHPLKRKHTKVRYTGAEDLEAYAAPPAAKFHKKEREVRGLSATKASDEEAQVPYEFFGNGTGILAYIAGFFLSMFLLFLFWLVVFAILEGSLWLIGLLIGALVIALIVIIVAVVLNGD